MNIDEFIRADHERLRRLIGEHRKYSEDPERQSEIMTELARELGLHAQLTRTVVYSAVKADVEGGARLVEERLEDYDRIERILRRMSRDYARHFDELVQAVESHIRQEEEEFLPNLSAFPEGESDRLGRALEEERRRLLGEGQD